MADVKYGARHRRTREQWRPIVNAGQAFCVEPICLEERDGRGRQIQPGTRWDICHDPTGTITTGPGHARCNRSEGATRGNQQRAPRRWAM